MIVAVKLKDNFLSKEMSWDEFQYFVYDFLQKLGKYGAMTHKILRARKWTEAEAIYHDVTIRPSMDYRGISLLCVDVRQKLNKDAFETEFDLLKRCYKDPQNELVNDIITGEIEFDSKLSLMCDSYVISRSIERTVEQTTYGTIVYTDFVNGKVTNHGELKKYYKAINPPKYEVSYKFVKT